MNTPKNGKARLNGSWLVKILVMLWLSQWILLTHAEIQSIPAVPTVASAYQQNHQPDVDVYPFVSAQKQTLFASLINQLRCLVCQNENLADSNASLAKDLRKQIYQLVQQGMDANHIKSYLVARYGDFILFEPPFRPQTYLLWIGPFILLVIALLVLIAVITQRRIRQPVTHLTDDEQQQLDRLFK